MRATGIVRAIDDLGRIVIPKEIRKSFNIKEGDSLEIFTAEGGQVILKKYERGCVFCKECDDLVEYVGELVCRDCCKALGGM